MRPSIHDVRSLERDQPTHSRAGEACLIKGERRNWRRNAMTRGRLIGVAFVLFVLVCGQTAWAQTTGSIRGRAR